MSLLTLAQQTFELCAGESKTIKYFSEPSLVGNNIWSVNGLIMSDNDTLIYTFSNSGTYNIILRRENVLCYVEESIQVVVTDCPGVIYWVPNTFTPDGNEYNQFYGPVMTEGFDLDGFKFLIFNRWGEIVWESEDPNGRWDGTYKGNMCTDGVYIWKLNFNVFGNDKRITDHGHLTLIR